jgi:hypothetical protein
MEIKPISRVTGRQGYRDNYQRRKRRDRGKSFGDVYDNTEIDESEIERVVVRADGTHDLSNTTIGLGLRK